MLNFNFKYMNNQHNAKYAFYYLLSLVALIFMSLGVGMIVFGIINKTVPDALNLLSSNIDSQLKFAISALLIASPIFYLVVNLIYRGLKKEEISRESGIRRWLTYLTILISALIILGVFIGVINSFLSGDLTGQFVLKALTILVIAGLVFSFYFYDIRRREVIKKDIIFRIFFWVSLVLTVVTFVASWFFVESPQLARQRRLDQVVINNIYSLESAVNSYYDRYNKLPDDLMAIKGESDIYLDDRVLVDPETREVIVYQKTGEQSFQFCATFRTDSDLTSDRHGYPIASKRHAVGYQCLSGTLWSVIQPKIQ